MGRSGSHSSCRDLFPASTSWSPQVKTWMAGPSPAMTSKNRQFLSGDLTGQPWVKPGHDEAGESILSVLGISRRRLREVLDTADVIEQGGSRPARSAATSASPTTAAASGTAPSVGARPCDRGSRPHPSTADELIDSELHHIAAAQLAVDGEIEKRAAMEAPFAVKPEPDGVPAIAAPGGRYGRGCAPSLVPAEPEAAVGPAAEPLGPVRAAGAPVESTPREAPWE
jgi:hypothetical protein